MVFKMKLSADAEISEEKVKNYLLVWRSRSDKSQWLASAGYTLANWRQLQSDIRNLLVNDATFVRENPWGRLYEIRGILNGPSGKTLYVRSIWMIESETGRTKFITLYADKKK